MGNSNTFQKTANTVAIFDMIKHVQEYYSHYRNLYRIRYTITGTIMLCDSTASVESGKRHTHTYGHVGRQCGDNGQ